MPVYPGALRVADHTGAHFNNEIRVGGSQTCDPVERMLGPLITRRKATGLLLCALLAVMSIVSPICPACDGFGSQRVTMLMSQVMDCRSQTTTATGSVPAAAFSGSQLSRYNLPQ